MPTASIRRRTPGPRSHRCRPLGTASPVRPSATTLYAIAGSTRRRRRREHAGRRGADARRRTERRSRDDEARARRRLVRCRLPGRPPRRRGRHDPRPGDAATARHRHASTARPGDPAGTDRGTPANWPVAQGDLAATRAAADSPINAAERRDAGGRLDVPDRGDRAATAG